MRDEEIMERCTRQGLELEAVSRQGVVLVLHPQPAAALPSATTLKRLSEELSAASSEFRYVTLSLEDETDAS